MSNNYLLIGDNHCTFTYDLTNLCFIWNSFSSQQKPIGDRDWNDSCLYQMIHSGDKQKSQQQQGHGQGQGHAPQPQTAQAHQPVHHHDYKFDAAVGLSDF